MVCSRALALGVSRWHTFLYMACAVEIHGIRVYFSSKLSPISELKMPLQM